MITSKFLLILKSCIFMDIYEEELKEAVRHLQIADHMTYVTFPLISEYRLLLKIFDEIYLSIVGCAKAALEYEALYKRISLYPGFEDNLDLFFNLARIYELNHEQVRTIKEIIELHKRHKKSAMEFVKQDRVVIMGDNLGTKVIDILTIKRYLLLAKELMVRVRKRVV